MNKKQYFINIKLLLNRLIEIKNIIANIETNVIPSDLNFLVKDMYLDENKAKKELNHIYGKSFLKEQIETLGIISNISQNILENYNENDIFDIFSLSKKEYYYIFVKNHN